MGVSSGVPTIRTIPHILAPLSWETTMCFRGVSRLEIGASASVLRAGLKAELQGQIGQNSGLVLSGLKTGASDLRTME